MADDQNNQAPAAQSLTGQPANLELNYTVPTVVTDGNLIFISDSNSIPTITFFQIRKQEGAKLSADAVASVRFNSLEDLRGLQKAIEDTIQQHTSREP